MISQKQPDAFSAKCGFRRMEIWNLAMALTKQIYKISSTFPKSELFCLTVQIRRAAISIPCNMAEGNARFSKKELCRYLSIALGSLAELETQLELAISFGYLGSSDKSVFRIIGQIRGMTLNYIKRLSR